MANEEVFEINDFSMASEWERFITDLEEILTEWNLVSSSQKNHAPNVLEPVAPSSSKYFQDSSLWIQKQEQIKFGKVLFCLNYKCYKATFSGEKKKMFSNDAWCEMQSFQCDWASSGHPLVRYYGLAQFLVLQPINQMTINTEDMAKHLIGSASIALSNMNCETPFFCQIGQLAQRTFIGVQHVNNGFRTYFDMIQFSKVPNSYQYLTDLEALFKKKLFNSFCYYSSNRESKQASSIYDETGRVHVSVRFTYLLNVWPHQTLLSTSNSILNAVGLEHFPDGHRLDLAELLLKPIVSDQHDHLVVDPLKQLQLATTWPSISEEMIVDNANYSYLQPRNAPKWSLRALYNQFDPSMPNTGQLPTTFCFATFLHLKSDQTMLAHYLHAEKMAKNDENVRVAFDRLTESSIPLSTTSVTNLVSSSATKYLSKLLQNLPANLKEDQSFGSQVESLVQMLFHSQLESKSAQQEHNVNIKAAPPGSLCWRLVLLLANVYFQSRESSSIAFVWSEIVRKLRQMWSECEPMQFMDHDENMSIDHSHCLLHQKLEMLNCCIRQKMKHEGTHTVWNDEEDEFFDCNETDDDEVSEKAEGRLEILKDSKKEVVYLLKQRDEPIYIPRTQEMCPQTEDMLAQQIDTLSSLEDNDDNQMARARFHSTSLFSDMEAFKAANPRAQFEDFIRWHSPRDWVEIDDGTKFGLSRRMQDSASTWQDLWTRAKPTPIGRQKRLFNYTKEAEQILQSFERITVSQLVDLLTPVLIKATTMQLLDSKAQVCDFINKNLAEADRKLYEDFVEQFFVLNTQQLESNAVEALKDVSSLEYKMLCFYSTLKKFIFAYEWETNKTFIELMHNKEAPKEEGSKTRPNKPTNKPGALAAVRTKASASQLNCAQLVMLVVKLLAEPEFEFMSTSKWSEVIIRLFAASEQFKYEQSTSVGDRLASNVQPEKEEQSKHRTVQPKLPDLANPSGKEFIFRAPAVARPSASSRVGPNRMYCLLTPNQDFRIASAFVEDTIFM